jgi:DNA helicase-2/ATP-dependent DNA helicase PcrA
VQSQADFDRAVGDFAEENKERHAEEERRLAYVALTRTRSDLLLTGSWWASQKAPRKPSPFLRELVTAGVIETGVLPGAPEHDENPRAGSTERVSWPLDPLGIRRPAVTAAAEAVRAAAARPSGEGIGPVLADRIRLLLEERRRRAEGPETAEVPVRVPASRFKDYVDDPAAVAAQLRRPMPQRPYRATRIGTLFHQWVEQRSTGELEAAAIDTLDGLEVYAELEPPRDESIADPTPERLRALQATFEASEWGGRKPSAVEIELHLPIGENVFVCKLDAVFDVEPSSELGQRGIRHQVVDWKTGKAPRDAHDLELKQTQLALYRLAFANWAGIEPDAIDAVFYFVEDDRVIRPDAIYDEAALRRAWASVAASAPVPSASA